VIAPALGSWLQYLRKQTVPFKQEAVAPLVGIHLDGVRRTERGENVGVEFLLRYLSWLDEELAATEPKRYQEFRDGLLDKLVEAGAKLRRAEHGEDKKPQTLPRAAVGERRKPHRAR